MKFIQHISYRGTMEGTGYKAASLHRMNKYHFRIPDTYVIPMKVHEQYAQEPVEIKNELLREIEKINSGNHSWAVRSSGAAEDLEGHSYAGQFATFLDVTGTEAIMEAIIQVWDSGKSIPEELYRDKSGAVRSSPGMSVILQHMVQAVWAGVAFSINPVTGRHELVIEAVKGSGANLVRGVVKPARWVLRQNHWEYDDDPDREIKDLPDELRNGLRKLQKIFGGPVDVEWAYNGRELYYLQCRKVAVSEFPTIYSNHISREVLPGLIKPLVCSVNIPLVNSAWIRLLEGLIGKLGIQPEQLSKSFYYRAYFNMGTMGAIFNRMGLPDDALENLMGRKKSPGQKSFQPSFRTLGFLPSILRFLLYHLFFLEKNFKKELSHIKERTDALILQMREMDSAEYPQYYNKIYALASEAAYYNIIIPLSFQISNGILRKKLQKRGISYEKLEFIRDFPELKDYDPNEALSEIELFWSELPEELQGRITGSFPTSILKDDPQLIVLQEKMQLLLNRFGHFSESGNDSSYPAWREEPGFLLDLIRRGGKDHTEKGERPAGLNVDSSGIPRRAYRRAGRFRLYREMISSEYTRCYGLFRELFLKTGKAFQEKGWIDDQTDVFYLTLEQHNRLFEGINQADVQEMKEGIALVKNEMENYSEMVLPPVIYGDIAPPVPVKNEEVLEGIPASPGIFSGELVVVRGYEDFSKRVEGKILVIPFSDVGWTPLLVRAGAIVSESGGMLSHASIIAREMSIPAITSVDHVCSLKDGTRAKVDGYNGIIILSK